MTAILTNAANDATANSTLTGESRVICSGTFSDRTKVVITLLGDALDPAEIYTFRGTGAIVVRGANNDTLTATVRDGDSDTSIDVSVTAI